MFLQLCNMELFLIQVLSIIIIINISTSGPLHMQLNFFKSEVAQLAVCDKSRWHQA